MDATTSREPPVAGDEADLLLAVLDRTRSVLAWKCGGLDAAGMRATLGPSAVTLGGLLKHLTGVEELYFTYRLMGRRPASPWDTLDWAGDPDWAWRTAPDESPEELLANWQAAVARSRANVAEVLHRGDMGQLTEVADGDGGPANLRRIVVDLIDEYARHNGHADLIRESVDGLVGEDPPSPQP